MGVGGAGQVPAGWGRWVPSQGVETLKLEWEAAGKEVQGECGARRVLVGMQCMLFWAQCYFLGTGSGVGCAQCHCHSTALCNC